MFPGVNTKTCTSTWDLTCFYYISQMKFQSLEESNGVSIFQEYIIGMNSLVEKKFTKLEYHYEYSLTFCIYISNLLKIGAVIYSNIIID